MLSLTRFPGQRIIIGDDIVIQVTRVRGQNVQIDIQAPREIPVHREEVYVCIQAEKDLTDQTINDGVTPDAA